MTTHNCSLYIVAPIQCLPPRCSVFIHNFPERTKNVTVLEIIFLNTKSTYNVCVDPSSMSSFVIFISCQIRSSEVFRFALREFLEFSLRKVRAHMSILGLNLSILMQNFPFWSTRCKNNFKGAESSCLSANEKDIMKCTRLVTRTTTNSKS